MTMAIATLRANWNNIRIAVMMVRYPTVSAKCAGTLTLGKIVPNIFKNALPIKWAMEYTNASMCSRMLIL